MPEAPPPTGHRPAPRTGLVVAEVLAAAALGALTALLGTSTHLARSDVAGTLLPWGVVLAVALVAATDLAVAAAALHRRRPRPVRALLGVAAGRAVVIGLLLVPRPSGDLVLTGLPASTAWILLALLLPAFLAPMATAVAVSGGGVGAGARGSHLARAPGVRP